MTQTPTLAEILDHPQTWEGYGPLTTTRTGYASEFGGATYSVSAILPESGRQAEVDVYGPMPRFGAVDGPRVNWSGIGSVSPGDAATYGALLAFAARVAVLAEGPTTGP